MCNFCPLPSVETHVRASYCLNISYIIFNILPEFYSTPLEDRFRNLGTKIKTWTGNAFPAKNSSLLHTEEMVPWIQLGGGTSFMLWRSIGSQMQLDNWTVGQLQPCQADDLWLALLAQSPPSHFSRETKGWIYGQLHSLSKLLPPMSPPHTTPSHFT